MGRDDLQRLRVILAFCRRAVGGALLEGAVVILDGVDVSAQKARDEVAPARDGVWGGEDAAELLHIGQAVFLLKGKVTYFKNTVFNYPTLAECYKTAAFNGLNRLA